MGCSEYVIEIFVRQNEALGEIIRTHVFDKPYGFNIFV